MLNKWAAILILLFLSQTTLAHESLTQRIFCRPQMDKTSQLTTLRSDVIEEYPMPTIQFYDENNKAFQNILAYQPWQGNGLEFKVFILAENKKGQINLYLSDVDLAGREARSQLVFNSRALSRPGNSLALSGEKLLFPGPRQDEFIIRDLSSGSQVSIRGESQLYNPRFSLTSGYLLFDQWNFSQQSQRQKAYDTKKSQWVFQTPTSKFNSSFLEFNPARSSWIFVTEGPKTASLNEAQQGRTTSHYNLNVRRPKKTVVYSYVNSQLSVIWAEFDYVKKEEDEKSWFEFNEAFVRVLSLTDEKVSVKSFPFGGTILNIPKTNGYLSDTFMSHAAKSPGSSEVLFSLGIYNGLTKLNLETGEWTTHGAFLCYEPQIMNEGN